MNAAKIADRLEQAAVLLKASASAFRHGRYTTACEKVEAAERLIAEAEKHYSY